MPLDKPQKRQILPDTSPPVLAALLAPESYPHQCDATIEHFETHISHIFLTGRYAYKVKKPLALGFLDYSSLELRRRYCEREVELNRRFAPHCLGGLENPSAADGETESSMYLGVAVIGRNLAHHLAGSQNRVAGGPDRSSNSISVHWPNTASKSCSESASESCSESTSEAHGQTAAANSDKPVAEILEYAVCMRQFDNQQLLSNLANTGALTEPLLLSLVDEIIRFHQTAEPRPHCFDSAHLRRVMDENFTAILAAASAPAPELQLRVNALSVKFHQRLERSAALIDQQRRGFVRLLHGDLHLGNVCMFAGRPTLFDCLEFNDAYASCDTWADIGFLIMDLFARGLSRFAWLVVNRYAEVTGDYDGLQLLPLYISYRAAVRAKVRALRLLEEGQPLTLSDREFVNYLLLAEAFTFAVPGKLWVVAGISGSGKSTVAKELGLQLGAIHLRSDAIRKHLLDVDLDQQLGVENYSSETSERVYQRLASLAAASKESGLNVVCDATFLAASQRAAWEKSFSGAEGFSGIWCECDPQVARARIRERQQRAERDPSDADLAVLDRQLASLNTVIELSPKWRRFSTDFPLGQLGTQVKILQANYYAAS